MSAELPYKIHLNLEAERRLERERRERIEQLSADAPKAQPKHGQPPTRRSQWDEAHGHWVEWDADADEWRITDGDGADPDLLGSTSVSRSDGGEAAPASGATLDDAVVRSVDVGRLDDIE